MSGVRRTMAGIADSLSGWGRVWYDLRVINLTDARMRFREQCVLECDAFDPTQVVMIDDGQIVFSCFLFVLM